MLLSLRKGNDDFTEEKISERFNIFRSKRAQAANNFFEDVRTGLTSGKKFLYPKYFYDKKGSLLFEQICLTKEYYLTRTEESILRKFSDSIYRNSPAINIISELGSGNSLKSEIIINEYHENKTNMLYTPIDISEISVNSTLSLSEKYSKLYISGIVSFYEEGLKFLNYSSGEGKMVMFLGSSIGNFTPEESIIFLRDLKKIMNVNDILLIGFDMEKDKSILEDAYNDEKGVTSDFNLNILYRINTELNADFDLNEFTHKAVYNEKSGRIEMYLIAKEQTDVMIPGLDVKIKFNKGESIHTENSYKFTKNKISNLAVKSGFALIECYSDERNYFSLCLFKVIN